MAEQLIDQYLDSLAECLRLPRQRARRVLAEAEQHLHEAAGLLTTAGLSSEGAQLEAIGRFGPPERVAAEFNREGGAAVSGRQWFGRFYLHFALLICTGLLAIGVSSLLMAGLARAWGKDYISGDLPGATYTPERCAALLEYHPTASDCEAAATAHHFDEAFGMSFAAGILGVAGLMVHLGARRKFVRGEPPNSLARRLRNVAAMFSFGLASIPLLANGIIWTVREPSAGGGLWLAEGLSSLVFFAIFARPGVNSLREMAEEYAA